MILLTCSFSNFVVVYNQSFLLYVINILTDSNVCVYSIVLISLWTNLITLIQEWPTSERLGDPFFTVTQQRAASDLRGQMCITLILSYHMKI